MLRIFSWVIVVAMIIGVAPRVMAAESGTVSMEEFNKLKADYEQLKQEVQQLKQGMVTQQAAQQQAVAPAVAPAAAGQYASAEDFDKLKDKVRSLFPGLSNFMVTGYGFTSYTDSKQTSSTQPAHSNFSAGVNPVFLYKMSDQLLFETELELSLEDSSTSLNLEFADAQYLLNDYMTVVAGKFITPFGIFLDRHPRFINKLTDKPYGYPDSAMLVPESQIGVQLRGGVPLMGDNVKGKYALYVSNGPRLTTTLGTKASAGHEGELVFDNTNDNNRNKAFGGRVGLVPLTGLDVGYSWEISRPNSKNDVTLGAAGGGVSKNVDAAIQGVDFSYVRDLDPIKGVINLKAEQIWSHVHSANYGTSAGVFQNDRWARYAQVSYRPSGFDIPVLKNLEPVFRFDQIHYPSAAAPTDISQNRYTWGLDYWFSPNVVGKVAYERISEPSNVSGSVKDHSINGEFAIGF